MAFQVSVDPITDWVEITTSGADSVVKVDREGSGGTQIATLQGITCLTDEAAFVSSGNLIAVQPETWHRPQGILSRIAGACCLVTPTFGDSLISFADTENTS